MRRTTHFSTALLAGIAISAGVGCNGKTHSPETASVTSANSAVAELDERTATGPEQYPSASDQAVETDSRAGKQARQARRGERPPAEIDRPDDRQSAGGRGPVKPEPILFMQPADGMTATEGTPLRVVLDNQEIPVSQILLDEVASQVRLYELPSGKEVPVDVITHNPAFQPPVVNSSGKDGSVDAFGSTPEPAPSTPYVQLNPKASLADSWHVLALASVPLGIKLSTWSWPTPGIGVFAARFHPKSQPSVLQAVFCKKSAGVWTATVEFSQNLQATASQLNTLIQLKQPGAVCALAVSGPVPTSSAKWAQWKCEGLDATKEVQLSFTTGLSSADGTPLKGPSGAATWTSSLTPNSLPVVSDQPSCHNWRP